MNSINFDFREICPLPELTSSGGSMDSVSIAWMIIFSVLFFIINSVYYLMESYIRDKPLGSKSLHDAVFKDMLVVTQMCGSTMCSVAVLSRIAFFCQVLQDFPIVLTGFCALYISAFMSACLILGCLGIVKILCIVNLTFMEEIVGETLARILVIGTIVIFDASACALFWFQDDLRTGTAMTLLTNTSVPTGNSRLIPLNKTLCVDIVDQQEMNNLYRTTH